MAQLPLQFATTGNGDSALCSWLVLVAHSLLADSSRPLPILYYGNSEVDHKQSIVSGVYEVQIRLGEDTSPAPGPHARTTRQKPFEQTESETISQSSKSSRAGQSPWKLKLFQRDQVCLISRTFVDLEACHIAPFSLGEDFVNAVSHGVCELYSPANGLTLKHDLHRFFDNFRLGIYSYKGKLFVHCFAVDKEFLQYHGQEIKFSKEIYEQRPEWLPNKDCLKWHYTQCILTSFRRSYVPFPPLRPTG